MSVRSPQPANGSMKIHRSYTPPAPYVVQLHEHGCNCVACEPYVTRGLDTLSATTIGKLMVAGIIVGLMIILTIDPAGTMVALRATIGIVS